MVGSVHGRFVTTLAIFVLISTVSTGVTTAADDVLAQGNLPGSYGVRFGPDGNL